MPPFNSVQKGGSTLKRIEPPFFPTTPFQPVGPTVGSVTATFDSTPIVSAINSQKTDLNAAIVSQTTAINAKVDAQTTDLKADNPDVFVIASSSAPTSYNTYADLPNPTTLTVGDASSIAQVTNDPNTSLNGLHVAVGANVGQPATHWKSATSISA